MSSFESESDVSDEGNIEKSQTVTLNSLPKKSCARYNTCYDEFVSWKKQNNFGNFTEDIFLIYFVQLSEKMSPSTLWSRWSMLKSVMNLNHNINLNDFSKLKLFMKNNSKNFQPKKSKIFTLNELDRFINEAPDTIYLVNKVIFIFGFCGALKSNQFCNITINDIEDTGSQYIITLKTSQYSYHRSFVIGTKYYAKIKQYANLRPIDTETDRFFISYHNGKCTRQVIGRNKISETPKMIAIYLNLKNPQEYTGHCFRRTSAAILANSGVSQADIKQHRIWHSNNVVVKSFDNSVHNNKQILDIHMDSEETSTSSMNYSMSVNQTHFQGEYIIPGSIENSQVTESSFPQVISVKEEPDEEKAQGEKEQEKKKETKIENEEHVDTLKIFARKGNQIIIQNCKIETLIINFINEDN